MFSLTDYSGKRFCEQIYIQGSVVTVIFDSQCKQVFSQGFNFDLQGRAHFISAGFIRSIFFCFCRSLPLDQCDYCYQ